MTFTRFLFCLCVRGSGPELDVVVGGSREEGGVWPTEQEGQLLCMEAVSTSDVICGQHLEQWGRNDPLGTERRSLLLLYPGCENIAADQSFNITNPLFLDDMLCRASPSLLPIPIPFISFISVTTTPGGYVPGHFFLSGLNRVCLCLHRSARFFSFFYSYSLSVPVSFIPFFFLLKEEGCLRM